MRRLFAVALLLSAVAGSLRAERYRVGLGTAEEAVVPDAASYLERLPGMPRGATPAGRPSVRSDPAPRPPRVHAPPPRAVDPVAARKPVPEWLRGNAAVSQAPDGTFRVDAARIDDAMRDEASINRAWQLFAREPAELPAADRMRNAVIRARLAAEAGGGDRGGGETEAGEGGPRGLEPDAARGARRGLEPEAGGGDRIRTGTEGPTGSAVVPVARLASLARAVVRNPGTWLAEAPFGRGTKFLPARSVIWILPGGHGAWLRVAPPAGPGWACVLYLEMDGEQR